MGLENGVIHFPGESIQWHNDVICDVMFQCDTRSDGLELTSCMGEVIYLEHLI